MQDVLHHMTHWLEKAVIGLNLCPFAKAPHVKGQIHYAVSEAKGLEGLRDELIATAPHSDDGV
jgi:hypothetical protein